MAAVAPPPQSHAGPANISRPSSVASKREKSIPVAGSSIETKPSGVTIKVEDEGDEKDRKPDAGRTSKSRSPSAPVRPHIRPVAASQSKHDLEPNPFEQSFRQSQTSVSSASDHAEKTPPRGGDATSIKHNALPPLSSLTSPAAADPSQFPWLASQSLRAGPLSPAMLQGPQHANGGAANGGARGAPGAEASNNGDGGFDSSTFRTGFTPGAGTGFTPGYTSLMNAANFGALPMPSPNTAAFLNMVTNATPLAAESGDAAGAHPPEGQTANGNNANSHAGPLHPPSAIPPHMQQQAGHPHPPHGLAHINQRQDVPQETITPNTLSALTGAINEMNRSGSNPGHPGPPPPPGGMYYPGQQMHGQMPPPMAPNVDYAQQSANAASQAANGLFLLSQAHHELSKREQEVDPRAPPRMPSQNGGVPPQAVKPMMNGVPGGVPGGPAGPGGPGAPGGQKRKSDAGAGPAGKSAAKKGKKAGGAAGAAAGGAGSAAPMDFSKGESTSPKFSMDGDSDDDDGTGGNKNETEEDKRKNFLERNRQAALKCRQRKKAWLGELQNKVEVLQRDNEALQQTVHGLHEEIGRLNGLLIQHGVVQPYGRPLR